jgi:uncharacterized DUF497 family protein
MAIIFDQDKRLRTLSERGLNFARCGEIFEEPHLTIEDKRLDYGEPRYITIGMLDGRMVVFVWTPRDADMRVISMRKANDREQASYGPRLHSH